MHKASATCHDHNDDVDDDYDVDDDDDVVDDDDDSFPFISSTSQVHPAPPRREIFVRAAANGKPKMKVQ